jgi:thermostable 8-oxoguanine DNA glycosylase
MKVEAVKSFFNKFPKDKVDGYCEYWDSITPTTHEEIFKRYLFAFCSVHTTFQGNIKGYQAIQNFEEWFHSKELLLEKLKNSGSGLYNNRSNYIWDFKNQFWNSTKDYYFTSKKCHLTKRDQIVDKINGLGMAKVSFALEMIHPNDARVLCGDIHQLRLYGLEDLKYNNKQGREAYKKMESNWVYHCSRNKVPSYIARSIYWDQIQEQENTRYWSFVFE